MMEVSCAPGPTSLPLSSSVLIAATTTTTTTTAITPRTTITTTSDKQGNTSLSEVSPDSGNGEDLDEFDSLKSPVKVSDTKCESEKEAYETAAADDLTAEEESHLLSLCEENLQRGSSPCRPDHDAPNQEETGEKSCNTDKCDKQVSEMTACMTEKPELFRLDLQSDQSTSERSEWQTGKQPDLPSGGTCSRPMRGTYYSPAFNLRPLHSSLLVSCSQPFQCGSFSSPCGALGKPRRGIEENGLFSLPEGGDDMLDGSLFSKSYLLGDNGRTCIKPFSLISRDETESFHKRTSNCCDTSYSLGAPQPVKTVRNPEYPRCLRSRPARRYTNPEVVRKQPTSGCLVTNSCDLMTSPPGQCTCINPGTSHACAPRLSGKSSLGVLNPMFECKYSSNQETHTAVPSSPRRFSLDHGSSAKCSGNLDVCRSQPSTTCLSSINQEPSKSTPGLSRNSREPLRRASESSSGTNSHDHLPLSSTSSEDLASKSEGSTKKTSLPSNFESLGSAQQTQNSKSTSKCEALAPENGLRSLESMSSAIHGTITTKLHGRPPMVTSPDWISFLSPPQDAYTQRLFTPENLQEELFYPAPYGLRSEIYQNINAREADFVLQKPNRKPRTEPLPPSCLQPSATQRPDSPDLQDGIIPPLVTEDEEALQEGARESRKASLKERRKSSLEKLYIPKTGEPRDPILNVKIDNFDREEYVKYKKTLSGTDSYISERLKFAAQGRQSSLDSDSSSNAGNHVIPCNQEPLELENFSTKENDKNSKKTTASRRDSTTEQLQERKEVINENMPQADTSYSRADVFCLKGTVNGKTNVRKETLPRQRSLEENETASKASSHKTARKQSLPTEELFGIKRHQQLRKLSLSHLMSHQVQLSSSAGVAAFSPVTEAEEGQTPLGIAAKKKNSDILFSFGDEKQETLPIKIKSLKKSSQTRPPRRKASHENERELFLSTATRSLPGDEIFFPYKGTSTPGKKIKNIQKRKEKQSDSPHHHHHHQGREGAHNRHRTEHLLSRPGKSSFLPADDRSKKQKQSTQRSPRKTPMELRRPPESHTNLGAPLSPPKQEAAEDLFTNRRSSTQGRQRAEVRPAVPYERLVDALTPTTPDDPPAASGATRKERHRGRHRRTRARDVSVDEQDSDETSSPSFSLSKSSSSSSSTLTSFSGGSNKDISSSASSSSSSSSSSSCSDSSTCSSSSSSESSSSSSDSSDIEDLIP